MTGLFCNGQPADASLLAGALVNYGHFTSLQVRSGAVQGWALHVQRLQTGTLELFDAELDSEQVLHWLKDALAQCGVCDASVRITVFSRFFDFRHPLRAVPVDVLIAISAPAAMPPKARSVLPVRHQRELPHIKHVGTFELFHQRRQAMRAGFNDALFIDSSGKVCEGTTWNLAFWDGREVLWPRAAALRGTAEQLLMAGLEKRSQPQACRAVMLEEIGAFTGAIACNATGVWPLARIGEQGFEQSDRLLEVLQQALAEVPWVLL